MLMMVILLSKILDENGTLLKVIPIFVQLKQRAIYMWVLGDSYVYVVYGTLSKDKCRYRVESEGEIANFD